MHTPTKLPADPPRKSVPPPSYQARGEQRLAFDMTDTGVRAVPPQGPFAGNDGDEFWDLETGSEIGRYPTENGYRIEMTAGILDGSTPSMDRLAKVLGMLPVGPIFRAVYAELQAARADVAA